jgi:hypothetical protein
MAIFNKSSSEEIEPIELLRTTFAAGTHPIGQERFGLQVIAQGIYRIESNPANSGEPARSRFIGWAFHNSPNPSFDKVKSGGNHTPFLLPVAEAKFLTVESDGGIWTLVEAY